MTRIIFHIDVNSAYLSWTAISLLKKGEPTDLRTIPSIIGGSIEDRHGIVLAKSTPAKKHGIVTGEPIIQAMQKCPESDCLSTRFCAVFQMLSCHVRYSFGIF